MIRESQHRDRTDINVVQVAGRHTGVSIPVLYADLVFMSLEMGDQEDDST